MINTLLVIFHICKDSILKDKNASFIGTFLLLADIIDGLLFPIHLEFQMHL